MSLSSSPTLAATRLPVLTSYERLLEAVRYAGAYPTRERAEKSVRLVLAELGRQLPSSEREELAASLPEEAARLLAGDATDHAAPMTGWSFVKTLATRTGTAPAVMRWDVGSVLTSVAGLVDPDLLTRLLRRLPSGYALLFGRAELVPAA
ncbi:DUF2267 domain-containing protein [Streptomyces sp. NPDC090306]|uniref:DUF2267 domain-containing protein n=1 Tax=Streptomyces sp. NPDC090306 TaxID=3365961 RepID=UPI00382627C4